MLSYVLLTINWHIIVVTDFHVSLRSYTWNRRRKRWEQQVMRICSLLACLLLAGLENGRTACKRSARGFLPSQSDQWTNGNSEFQTPIQFCSLFITIRLGQLQGRRVSAPFTWAKRLRERILVLLLLHSLCKKATQIWRSLMWAQICCGELELGAVPRQ